MIRYSNMSVSEMKGAQDALISIIEKRVYPNGKPMPEHCADTLKELAEGLGEAIEARQTEGTKVFRRGEQ